MRCNLVDQCASHKVRTPWCQHRTACCSATAARTTFCRRRRPLVSLGRLPPLLCAPVAATAPRSVAACMLDMPWPSPPVVLSTKSIATSPEALDTAGTSPCRAAMSREHVTLHVVAPLQSRAHWFPNMLYADALCKRAGKHTRGMDICARYANAHAPVAAGLRPTLRMNQDQLAGLTALAGPTDCLLAWSRRTHCQLARPRHPSCHFASLHRPAVRASVTTDLSVHRR